MNKTKTLSGTASVCGRRVALRATFPTSVPVLPFPTDMPPTSPCPVSHDRDQHLSIPNGHFPGMAANVPAHRFHGWFARAHHPRTSHPGPEILRHAAQVLRGAAFPTGICMHIFASLPTNTWHTSRWTMYQCNVARRDSHLRLVGNRRDRRSLMAVKG